ncbi:MAG: hypothetical protein M1275_00210, partial [Patescibacteria group bacterium]|nr:hypothetical protein [Patescibacteria group bacterium]
SSYLFGSALLLAQLTCAVLVYGGQALLSVFRGFEALPWSDLLTWDFFGQVVATLIVGYILAYLCDQVLKPNMA